MKRGENEIELHWNGNHKRKDLDEDLGKDESTW